MLDLHSHILPWLDDGSKNMAETLGMVRQLHAAGFKTLIATPHVLEGRDFLSPAEILFTIEKVRKCLAEAEIPVEILPGAEVYIFPDMVKWVRERKLLTLGDKGKYILLELPLLEIPDFTEQVFFELQVLGITPVLAHPERYRSLYDQPERVLDWARKGIILQLDLRSIRGYYGPQARQLAEIMLKSDLSHVLGSDSHRVADSELSYLEGLQSIKEIVGKTRYHELTSLNPQTLLEGNPLPGERNYSLRGLSAKKKKQRFWNLFVNYFSKSELNDI
ncbi:MAG: histidinol-phosphatase [Desulfitobacteriaceae bacterium]|nr:histidinol-phosphatase [Desulfitobacteriaceae bacterium]MDD4400727.1 histidinol-phosphatase [Desulfitobacteriaceae bacterium]